MNEEAFSILAANIVNPRCDECGRSARPANPLLGPHLCFRWCSTARNEQRAAAELRDFLSQERPDRSVHIVKLPQ